MDTLTLDQLKYQLKVLNNDKQKAQEKVWEIVGATKVIEFLINELSRNGIAPIEEVSKNGN